MVGTWAAHLLRMLGVCRSIMEQRFLKTTFCNTIALYLFINAVLWPWIRNKIERNEINFIHNIYLEDFFP